MEGFRQGCVELAKGVRITTVYVYPVVLVGLP